MKYQLRGFESLHRTDCGCDAERASDTLKDARQQARYMMTDAYKRASEASSCITLVQIWNGQTLVDEVRV